MIDKIRVVYNPANLESCLAVGFLLKAAKEHVCKIDVVSYNRITYVPPAFEDFTITFVIGCEMQQIEYQEEMDACSEMVAISYINGEMVELHKGSDKIFLQYTPNSTSGQDSTKINALEESADNSVTKLLFKYFTDAHNYSQFGAKITQSSTPYSELDQEEKDLIQSVFHYSNFMPMSEDDLFILYRYYDDIILSVQTKGSHNFMTHEELTIKKPTEIPRIRTARGIIGRNFSSQQYFTNQKSKFLPTICVNEEYSHDVMRLINFSYKELVAYEDMRHWRIWRILAETQTQALDIAGMIPHKDRWFDNKILYLVSDIPAIIK